MFVFYHHYTLLVDTAINCVEMGFSTIKTSQEFEAFGIIFNPMHAWRSWPQVCHFAVISVIPEHTQYSVLQQRQSRERRGVRGQQLHQRPGSESVRLVPPGGHLRTSGHHHGHVLLRGYPGSLDQHQGTGQDDSYGRVSVWKMPHTG